MKIKEAVDISVGSSTAAEKASFLIRRNGIMSKVKKIESDVKGGGCLFGISVNIDDAGNAMRILRANGINARTL